MASVRAINKIYIFGGFADGRKRAGIHPEWRQTVANFEADSFNAGYKIKFISSHRERSHQAQLRKDYLAGKSNVTASAPGRSMHEVGLAFDIKVWNPKLNRYDKKSKSSIKLLKEISDKIGKKHTIRWGGTFTQSKNEQGHWDYGLIMSRQETIVRRRKKLFLPGFEKQEFIILDGARPKSTKRVSKNWSTEIGDEATSYEEEEVFEEKKDPPKPIQYVEEREAVGIWQIVKVLTDRYALSQSINDGTIAFDQGSLINFVKKVVQEPWLEFFGDTYKDQFYFTARKERFDQNGWNNLFLFEAIRENEVISDDLNWYTGPIYSWYQIIPSGSFLGEQNQIFAHVTAVFFEEFAEVWGSKPYSQVSNYINFVKNQDGPIMYEKAMQDLRYMVESNIHLPFTREGSITVRGAANYRRGQRVFYKPTQEVFYIDGVNNRWVITEGGEEFITTLKVSRGMERRHLVTPKDKTTKSYWNLILFDDPPPVIKIEKEKVDEVKTKLHFDNDRSYKIVLTETWPPSPDTRDKKMENQIKEFPNLRKELDEANTKAISLAVKTIEDNPDAPKFLFIGTIDEDFGNKDSVLPLKRAKTFRTEVLKEYMKKHPSENKTTLEKKMLTQPLGGGARVSFNDQQKKTINDPSEKKYKEKAFERFAGFQMPTYFKDKEVEEEVKGVNWKVNDEVFQYFLNRKQFNKCS